MKPEDLEDLIAEPLKKCKKPFKKIVKISEQDVLKFLAEQGYNTEGYKLGSIEILKLDVHVTLDLIEEKWKNQNHRLELIL